MRARVLFMIVMPVVVVLLAVACGVSSSDGAKITIARITPAELNDRIAAGEQIMIVDVRSRSSYDSGHIPGSVSVPGNETENRLSEFPTDRPIVSYCT